MPFDAEPAGPDVLIHIWLLWHVTERSPRFGLYAFEVRRAANGGYAWTTLHDLARAIRDDPRKHLFRDDDGKPRRWRFDEGAAPRERFLPLPLGVFATDEEITAAEIASGVEPTRFRPIHLADDDDGAYSVEPVRGPVPE